MLRLLRAATEMLGAGTHMCKEGWREQGGQVPGARYQPYKPTRNSQTTPAPPAQPPAHTARQYRTQPSRGDAPGARKAGKGDPADPCTSTISEGCRGGWRAPFPLPKPPAPSISGRIYRAVPVTHRLSNCRMAVVKNPICQRIRILLALPVEK